MTLMTALYLVFGGVLLTIGADMLVRGASRLAAIIGISPLVIGLTVVAFGTSAPELAVSVGAALSGQGEIAVGNVVGSNIFNILFILGLSALIRPLPVTAQLVRLDVPVMVFVSILVFVLGYSGFITRSNGLIFLAGLLAYVVFLYFLGKKQGGIVDPELAEVISAAKPSAGAIALNIFYVLAGLGLLVLGANWFVASAVDIARWLGVSELVIGLTIVAAGTSLPEVATSIIAAVKGQQDIAVGNIIGSNTFNILCVLGATAVVAPGGLVISPEALWGSIPVMIAVAIFCLPVFFTGARISRVDGAFLFLAYIAYTVFLVLDARQSTVLDTYLRLIFFGFVPLVVVLAIAGFVHHLLVHGFRHPHGPK